MKTTKIFAAAIIILCFASCNTDGGKVKQKPVLDVAYLSIDVAMQSHTRSSSEEEDIADESALKSLYLITFDESDNIVGIPGGSSFYIRLDVSELQDPGKPQAVKVSAASKNLVVIANPGPALIARLNTLTGESTLATFNAAISGIDITEIKGDATRGFAMITAGDETGKTAVEPNNKISNPYVDIDGKIITITGTEPEAKAEAEKPENRVEVKLERLATKLSVSVVEPISALTVHPSGAKFDFEGWTADVLNTTYFPFAEKTILSTTHNSTLGSYVNNFYTKDPNFDDVSPYHTGLVYGTVNGGSGSFAPALPWNGYYGWKEASTASVPVYDYVTENTMAANAQRYGNATRLIIKGIYTPVGFNENADWFRWAGVNYQTLTELQTAHSAPNASQELQDACDNFYVRIAAWWGQHSELGALDATDFESLTQEHLDKVTDGGQVVKNGQNPVIRWYQKGLNYYYYEIRHDNEADGTMAFAKYGVVRNNLYRLTLNLVSGPGTPWYPDLNDGDPDPQDPIDEEAGYLGLSVSVNEWILWEKGFGI